MLNCNKGTKISQDLDFRKVLVLEKILLLSSIYAILLRIVLD